jgi:diphthamide synthase (EF-2-diphthine--ammonia ligase)
MAAEPSNERIKTVLSWSSGKDCSYALHVLRTDPAFSAKYDVRGLLSTVNESVSPNRVAMHGTRDNLVRLQAKHCSLPNQPLELHLVPLPSPCPNAVYEERMGAAVARLKASGAGAMAFGDIFLQDVRAYREEKMKGTGLECLFPLWPKGHDTAALAREMIAAGLRATLVCVDPRRLPGSLAGRTFDASLLEDLDKLRRAEAEKAKEKKGEGEEEEDGGGKEEAAASTALPKPPGPPPPIDDCGENGEFHTFAWAGPAFVAGPIDIDVAPEAVELNGFYFCDVALKGEMTPDAFRAAAKAAKEQAAKNAEAMAKARAENECPVQTVAREKEKEKEKEAEAAKGGGCGGGGD